MTDQPPATELDHSAAENHYNTFASQMQNQARFYHWLIRVIERAGIHQTASVLDIGCGTGALLRALAGCGFVHLTGIDFSPGCLELASGALVGKNARLYRHNIEDGPLDESFDLVLVTNVFDFLPNPGAALRHIRATVGAEGTLVLTCRNRLAYWPWYHAGPLVRWPGWPQWIGHWLQWFALPLPMRRSDQPFERIGTPSEMRRLLEEGGFSIVSEHAADYLPMLRIPGIRRLEHVMDRLDALLQTLPATPGGYQYLFVCRKD